MDILNNIDFASLTLAGLAVLGAVNVATIFKPTLSSKSKFILSLVVAFAVSFVPADFGNIILNHLKDAITVALAASGTYKIASKAGGQ